MATENTQNNQLGQGTSTLLPPETLDERRRRWVHLLRNLHYEPVIFELLSDELPKYANSRVIDPTELTAHMRECALILASAPKTFYAAVEGNLVSCMLQDADLQAEYAIIQQRAHLHPSIYVHLLADAQGNAPTPIQYLVIRDLIYDYTHETHSNNAHSIDNITPPEVSPKASATGHRKYLSTPSSTRSSHRINTLHRLCTGTTTRISQTPPHLHSTPLPFPPSEVGYALNAHKRLAQHRAHHSSNPTMNLVEDICTHLFRTDHPLFPTQLTMHQFIVYLIFRPQQAPIAEVLVSALLQSWVESAGFNGAPAGRSVSSVGRVGRGEWRRFEEWAEGRGLQERMGMLKARAGVWGRALKEVEDGDERDEEMHGEGESGMNDRKRGYL